MSKIEKALRVARRKRKKFAEGGKLTMDDIPTQPGEPLIGNGGVFSEGVPWANKAAKIGSILGSNIAYSPVTVPYHIVKNMVDGSKEYSQTGELSPKSVEGAGELVMQGVGASAGIRPGGGLASGPVKIPITETVAPESKLVVYKPKGAYEAPTNATLEQLAKQLGAVLGNDKYPQTPLSAKPAKGAKKETTSEYLDFEKMGDGTYEVFDPVSGKTLHKVKSEAEAKKLTGQKTITSTDFKETAKQAREGFKNESKAFEDLYQLAVKDPREYSRIKGGYTEPVYRGLNLSPGKEPTPVHKTASDNYSYADMYSTANPDLADMYAGGLHAHPGRQVPEGTFSQGSQVMPLYVNPKEYHYYDAGGGSWQHHNDIALEQARNLRKKGVIIDNVWDEPGNTKALKPSKVFVTLPSGASTVKSRFAKKFDPDSPNMLEARTGLGSPSIDREQKAGGGGVGFDPMRRVSHDSSLQGAIRSSVPGRTDKINANVPAGSSIVPADVVSALGQGNTEAGFSALGSLIKKGPYGMNIPKAKAGMRVGPRRSSRLKMGFAEGGEIPHTPIVVAGGEYAFHPEEVMQIGGGDLDLGHEILNEFYEHVRKTNIQTLKGLKGPKNG